MSENFKKGRELRTRTTFKVTVAGRRVVDFLTLRKGDKFILQDDDPLLGMEKGNVCNVATSDAYLRGGIWTIDCEEIEGSPVRWIKRTKRGSHPDDWAKTFTVKSSSKVTKEDLLNDDPIFPFTTCLSEVAEEIMKIEDERILDATLNAIHPIKNELINAEPYKDIETVFTRPFSGEGDWSDVKIKKIDGAYSLVEEE